MRLNILAGVLALLTSTTAAAESRCFPDGFLFGSATASYQVEGAVNAGGRTPSIWDDFCRERPGLECANVADDFYHRYKEDIQLMVESGLKQLRFSISWSRLMNWDPSTKKMKANQLGIDFYHDLIDELNRNHVTPVMTIYHWDLPIELQTELSPPGWLNRAIVDHYMDFAELIFQEFGAKVNYWTTFNEPWAFVGLGYALGMHAPGFSGSDTQAYTAAHNVLLSHGRAVQRFRELKATDTTIHSSARIGIVLPVQYSYPLNASDPLDVAAADRQLQFTAGWFLNPVVHGEYPAVMRERVGDRLPQFTAEEAAILKGSYDLFMLNHYASSLVTDCTSKNAKTSCDSLSPGWERDMGLDGMLSFDASRLPKGARWAGTGNDKCGMFSGYPPGYLDTMKWMHAFDKKADILLTENGWCGNETIDNQDQLWYYQTHLEQVYKAIKEENIPVIGYTVWSFVDNYEWGSFKPRFGMFYVNFTSETGSKDYYTSKKTDLARIPRTAAKWYAQVAKSNCLDVGEDGTTANIATVAGSASSSTWSSHHWAIGGAIVAVAGVIAVMTRRNAAKRSSHAERRPLVYGTDGV